MSSDNYNLVMEQPGGKWECWQNLDASSEFAPKRPPQRTFSSFEEAFMWADESYAEYGTRVARPAPSKEGTKE